MSGLAGAGNKTRNYQQQKQLQYLLDCTWYKIYISNKFMEIFLIFLTKNHLCSTAWSKGNLVLLVNNFQRSIVFLPCPCVSPSIDPWVTEAWNQYIHAQLELDRSWWIFPSIIIISLTWAMMNTFRMCKYENTRVNKYKYNFSLSLMRVLQEAVVQPVCLTHTTSCGLQRRVCAKGLQSHRHLHCRQTPPKWAFKWAGPLFRQTMETLSTSPY